MKIVAVSLLLGLVVACGFWAGRARHQELTPAEVAPLGTGDPAAALQSFNAYVERMNSFDPAFVDFYADYAVIHLTLFHSSGIADTGFVSITKLKANAQDLMETARRLGLRYEFTDLRASPSSRGVTIQGQLTSPGWGRSYPYTVTLMQESEGIWKIVEEWTKGPYL